MRKSNIKWLSVLLLVMLLGMAALAGGAQAEDGGIHNTILVIDTSASASDPEGLRYDAARLVCENLLTRQGALGVVLFGGTGGCESYGPLSPDADRAALDGTIGDALNAAANHQGATADIAAALKSAYAMQKGFDRSATDVLLLASENVAPSQRAIVQAGKLRDEGASIYIVTLSSSDADEFLRQLTDGDKLVYATAGELGSKFVQTLVTAESAPEETGLIAGNAPLEGGFTVPYAGLTDATVNLTFLPGDKARLGEIALVSPGGLRFELWKGGAATAAEGIGLTEGRSYIMLDIPAPEAGEWTVSVTGDGAPVEIVPRLNHGLRLNLKLRSLFDAGEKVLAEAWFQKYDGGAYEDLADSEIYDQTQAELLLYAPGSDTSGEPTLSVPMTLDENGRWQASYDPEGLGIWTAKLRVRNDYLTEELKYNAFEITDAPTPTPVPTPTPTPEPTPTPTPLPEVAKLQTFELSMDGLLTDSRGKNYIDGTQEDFTVAWTVEGETDSIEAALMKDGKPLLTGLHSGDVIPTSELEAGHNYSLRVSVVPKNGLLAGHRPMVKSIGFKLAPSVGEIRGIDIDVQPRTEGGEEILIPRDAGSVEITWTVNGATDSAKAVLLEDGNVIRNNLRTGTLIQRSTLKDEAAYTVRVSAMPQNGTLLGAEEVVRELSFRLYPEAQPIAGLALALPGAELKKDAWRFEGNRAQLTWSRTSGEVERYILKITDSKGGAVAAEGLPGDAASYTVELPKNDDYTVELTATPKHAQDNSLNATATLVIRPHIKNFFEKYWYFLAGGLAALLAIIGLVLLLVRRSKGRGKAKSGGRVKVDRKATYIVGTLHVWCEELELDAELKFDRPQKGGNSAAAAVKEGEPITAHPELAKLKGEEAHRLLNGVKLSMARADSSGKVEGEKQSSGHQPNAQVIGLTSLLPTGAKEVRYVGEYDIGDVTLRRRSPDGDYDFIFWGAGRSKPLAAPEPEKPAEAPAAAPDAAAPDGSGAEKPVDLNTLAEQVLAGSGYAPRISLAKPAPEPEAEKPVDPGTLTEQAPAGSDHAPGISLSKSKPEAAFDTDAAQDGDAPGAEKPVGDEAEDPTPNEDHTEGQNAADAPDTLASAYADMLDNFSEEEQSQPGELASAYADMLNDFPDEEENQPSELASAYTDMLNDFPDEEEKQPEEPSGNLASAYADMLKDFSDDGDEEEQPEESSSGLASAYADMLKGFSDGGGEEEKQPEEPSGGLASAYADMLKGFSDDGDGEEKQPEEPSGGLASAYADMLKGFSDDSDEAQQSEESSSGLASAYADFLNQDWGDDDEHKKD